MGDGGGEVGVRDKARKGGKERGVEDGSCTQRRKGGRWLMHAKTQRRKVDARI